MTESAKALDGVVNPDGSIVVSPDQAAQLGLLPGAHLRLVPVGRSLDEIMESVDQFQREQGIEPLSEDEAIAVAVKAVREVRSELHQAH